MDELPFYFPFIIWWKFGSFPLFIVMNNALWNLCVIFVETYISFFSDIHLFAELLAGSYDETTFNISRNWWSFTFSFFFLFTLFELFSFENYHLFLTLPVIFFHFYWEMPKFSKETVSFSIPTNNVWWFQFLHILTKIVIACNFTIAISGVWSDISLCFDLHLPNI